MLLVFTWSTKRKRPKKNFYDISSDIVLQFPRHGCHGEKSEKIQMKNGRQMVAPQWQNRYSSFVENETQQNFKPNHQ